MKKSQDLQSGTLEQTSLRVNGAIWGLLLCLSFLLYSQTAQRGIHWQDSGFHTLRIVTQQVHNPLGLALVHPLHHWMGRLIVSFETFEPSFAVTLISALAGAITVANLFACVVCLTGRRGAALFAALSMGLAHTFWQMSTVAETYTLTTALLTAELWCLTLFVRTKKPGYLLLMMLWNGLGISNHLLAMLTTPILIFVILVAKRGKVIRLSTIVWLAVLWLLGSLPYTYLVADEMVRTGEYITTLQSALFGNGFAKAVLNVVPEGRRFLISMAFMGLNFPNLLLPLAAYGLFRIKSDYIPPLLRTSLLAALMIHGLFVFRYNVLDQHIFFIPTYLLLTILGGVGFASLTMLRPTKKIRTVKTISVILLCATPLLYSYVPTLARRWDVLGEVGYHKPYRDDYVYLFTPWSVVERSAERMSQQAVELAGEHGLILIEDRMAEFAIRYQAWRGGLADLAVLYEVNPQTIQETIEKKGQIVLVPLHADSPKIQPPFGKWVRQGDLYVLDVDRMDFGIQQKNYDKEKN